MSTYLISLTDNCVLTAVGQIGLVKNIVHCEGHIQLLLSLYTKVNSLFSYPLHSEEIDIFCVSEEHNTLLVLPLAEVLCKCVRLPVDEVTYAVMPLIHSM